MFLTYLFYIYITGVAVVGVPTNIACAAGVMDKGYWATDRTTCHMLATGAAVAWPALAVEAIQ